MFCIAGLSEARLVSSPIDYNSTICSPWMMTCTGIDLQSLSFFIDNVNLETFTYFQSVTVPRTLYDTNDVRIDLTEVTVAQSITDIFNATAVLTSTTLAISRLDADMVRCGTNAFRSQNINLRVNVHGTL